MSGVWNVEPFFINASIRYLVIVILFIFNPFQMKVSKYNSTKMYPFICKGTTFILISYKC